MNNKMNISGEKRLYLTVSIMYVQGLNQFNIHFSFSWIMVMILRQKKITIKLFIPKKINPEHL